MPLARCSRGIISTRNQGGGDKKQGLPPSMGLGPFSMNIIQRLAGYCKCNIDKPELNKGVFVAITYFNDVMRSTDEGNTWELVDSVPSTYNDVQQLEQDWGSIAYGDGVFVVVSQHNKVMRSLDKGITLINATYIPLAFQFSDPNNETPEENQWWGVAYGEGIFMMVSFEREIMYSVDKGDTWISNYHDVTEGLQAIAFGKEVWVAVKYDYTAVYSTNKGVNWAYASTPTVGGQWIDVTYGGGVFVAVADQDSDGYLIMISENGTGWTGKDIDSTLEIIQLQGVIYGDGVFVAVSDDGKFLRSENKGSTWDDASDNVTTQIGENENETPGWSSIAYANGVFVAVSVWGKVIINKNKGTSGSWVFAEGEIPFKDWTDVAFGTGGSSVLAPLPQPPPL